MYRARAASLALIPVMCGVVDVAKEKFETGQCSDVSFYT